MNREVSYDDDSTVEDRIDERCDAFELAWQNGKQPNIVDFIGPEDDCRSKYPFFGTLARRA